MLSIFPATFVMAVKIIFFTWLVSCAAIFSCMDVIWLVITEAMDCPYAVNTCCIYPVMAEVRMDWAPLVSIIFSTPSARIFCAFSVFK